jgi:glycosyltransferase involved in cell wall biosynthesis
MADSETPTLSILICNLQERAQSLARLLTQLDRQTTDRVEVLIETDNRQVPTGTKRNTLLARAQGAFTAFIDDDDMVSPSYVRDVLNAIDSQPGVDCIGLKGIITFGGPARRNPRPFVHSVRCKSWHEANGVYYRTPNHLNPIASRHSKVTPFLPIVHGEDKAWSDALRGLLKSEVMVKEPLYFYESRD